MTFSSLTGPCPNRPEAYKVGLRVYLNPFLQDLHTNPDAKPLVEAITTKGRLFLGILTAPEVVVL